MDFKDYYKTLGVSKTATDKELKAAFRKLARKHHPDVNPGDKSAESRFKELNEAYEVLGDADKRRKYDELGANWRNYEQAGPAGQSGQPFGGGRAAGGSRTVTPEEFEQMFGGGRGAGGGVDFSDFFQTFFGGGGPSADMGGRTRAPRPGRDAEHELELTLEDALNGTTQRLQLTHGGQARTVDVRIPAGVGDGSRVRIAGEGEPGTSGAKSGDLFLRIRLTPHPKFERKGRDLYTRVALPLTTAVLGGEADVVTLAGKSLRLKVPPGTQNGQVFRLKGQGMPVSNKPEETGDLYATADVQLPRTLTDEQRRSFEELVKSGL